MTDLTEQWDKGKLPEGDYYIKRRNGLLLYDNIDSHGVWRNSIDEDIVEVLAPVPSYEEWQRILHYAGKYEVEYTSCVMDYENLKEENTKLKELLKECMYELENCYSTLRWSNWPLMDKIRQALGEDK